MLGRQPKLLTTMKKLFFIAAALFAAVSFSACSDEDKDDNLPVTVANLAGTWQITHSEGWVIYSDGTREDFSEDFPARDGWWTVEYREDGTATETSYNDSGSATIEESFTYTISGTTLTESRSYENNCYEIKSLSKNNLILFLKGEDLEGKDQGQKYEYTYTYKRI